MGSVSNLTHLWILWIDSDVWFGWHSYQVESLVSTGTPSSPLASGLVSLLYAASYTKQIINPILLVYVEFFLS